MKDGYFLVDKPAGPTAHDVVSTIRRGMGIRRIGHTGTLDPFATGLLVVLVGRATRLSQYLVGLNKEYTGTVRLGEATDTDDSTGETIAQSDVWTDKTEAQIRGEMLKLVGRYDQQPPIYSAKKVQGQRAYRLARRGDPVNLKAREIEVLRWDLEDRSGADITFSCEVSSGTYIRSLARDLGNALGCHAHLAQLRRTSVGAFRLEDAVQLEEIAAGSAKPGPPIDVVAHLPRQTVEDEVARNDVVHGKPIPAEEGEEGTVAVVANDELIAVAMRINGMLRPKVVLER